jgi:lipopolysaccharide export system permease protein
MKLIDRYIIRAFLVNYLIAMTVLVSMFVLIDLLVNLDEFTKSGETPLRVLANICSYYGHNLALYFSLLAGAITLVASAFTLGRMVRDNELTALLAAGVSLYRVAAPVIVLGILMNVLWIADQELIVPRIAHKLARERHDVEGNRTFGIWFIPDKDGALLSAHRFHPKTKQMRRMMVMFRDEQGLASRFITADSARWDAESNAWMLGRGTLYEHGGAVNGAGGLLAGAELTKRRIDAYHSNLGPNEIVLRQAAQWTNFLSVKQMTQLEKSGASNTRITQLKHKRFTQPLINMMLLLLGVPFFLTREPRPVLTSGAMCVGISGLFFVFSFISQNMVSTSSYPALPAWLPIIIFGPVVVVLLDAVKT